MERRRLTTNELFLISFILVLLVAIIFSWDRFSKRIKERFEPTVVEKTTQQTSD